MIRKIINIIPAILFAASLFFSCTAPIDIKTKNSEFAIVIYGYLTDEYKFQYVRVTSSSPYFDEKTDYHISNAEVWVRSSNGEEYLFVSEKNGYYISHIKFAGIPGVTYNLSVEVDFDGDGETEIYEAKTTLLPIVPVDSINITLIDIMGYRHFSLNFYMQEPAETENCYLFKFFINDSISNDKISELLVSDDRMYNGEYIPGANITYFEDATDEDVIEKNKDNDDIYMAVPGDRIRLQVLNIEKGYYNFINECISEKYGENPFFGGPPSNIATNMSNGAIGYFASYCVQEKTTVVP
ncbi:MAG: DUF4249 domain-containing protein [Tannerella sp.]|jgi:hypothetical protein|nr:DUF4249 domain-containing protein [Tannerella sp.]